MSKTPRPAALTVSAVYGMVMDEEVNPLKSLEKKRRLQIMTVLSWMWTTIFCASFGAWYLFDELVVAHVAVILGVAATAYVFNRAERDRD